MSESRTAGPATFEQSGGELCLDLANTRRYTEPERDDLPGYEDLLRWSEQAGTLGRAQAQELRSEARRRPREAERALARASALRLAIYRTFSAIAAGREPATEDVLKIGEAALEAWKHHRLVHAGGSYSWQLPRAAPEDLLRPLWPVARSAAELLTSEALGSVRECALETCAWLFLDRSKNQKRRWCDMKVCGNRSKARRHYRKTRKP